MDNEKYISVYFDDEEPMLQAVTKLLESNETIIDVMTPFPVHGIDRLLSIKRSRIPTGGFIFGILGAVSAFGFMAWVFTVSYPLIIGGKPFFAAPSFVPITFEVTILFAGLSMAAAMLIRSKLKPDLAFKPIDETITDNMFVILVDAGEGKTTPGKIRSILSGINIIEMK
ncbi:MAG: DUF3341 domain-containing protein [Bacteroidales bacterium]